MAERDVPPDPRFASATARSWRPMPGVLWPRACELVLVETAITAVAAWAATGARVSLLASQPARSPWICLSLGHWRVLLTGVESYLGVAERIAGPDAASSRGERARSAHFCSRE